MTCSVCGDATKASYMIGSRQDPEDLLRSEAALTRAAPRTSRVRRVEGYSGIRIFVRANAAVRIVIEENCKCADSDALEFRETARFDSVADPNGDQVIATPYSPTAPFLRIVESAPGVADATIYEACIQSLPVGACCEGGAWAGLNAPGGPGKNIETKADLAIAAAVETPILLAADIPPGTRRVTIQNVGANPMRIKRTGEAGGAGRGTQLVANQAESIGTRGGALDLLDGFSTLGTTLSFSFEKD